MHSYEKYKQTHGTGVSSIVVGVELQENLDREGRNLGGLLAVITSPGLKQEQSDQLKEVLLKTGMVKSVQLPVITFKDDITHIGAQEALKDVFGKTLNATLSFTTPPSSPREHSKLNW